MVVSYSLRKVTDIIIKKGKTDLILTIYLLVAKF